MDERTRADDITVDRQSQVVTILFGDGTECRFDFVEMRVHCPCAGCRSIRDKGGVAWPPPARGASAIAGAGAPDTDVDRDRQRAALSVRDARLVGAWGLSLTWSDGHSTGIYPWEAMRRWCDEGRPSLTRDSGLGA